MPIVATDSERPGAAVEMCGYNPVMNTKKLFVIDFWLIAALFGLFWLLIRFSATKETTWIDMLAIPIGLAIFLVAVLNITIFAVKSFEDRKKSKRS